MNGSKTYLVLNLIESDVKERVNFVEIQAERLRSTKVILRKYLLSVEQARPKPIISQPDESAHCDEITSEILGSSQLDNILSLAKEIRISGSSNTSSKGGDDTKKRGPSIVSKSKTRPSRQTLVEALLSSSSAAQPVISASGQDSKDRKLRQFITDIREQLTFLARHRISPCISVHFMTKDRYLEQSKYMSKIRGRAVHPRSELFATISPALPLNSLTSSQTQIEITPNRANDSIVVRLINGFSSLLASYERYLKARVAQKDFKASLLSSEDKTTLITLWLRGRKLVELYEHYIKCKSNLSCHCQSCSLKYLSNCPDKDWRRQEQMLHASTPLHTPLPLPSSNKDLESAEIERKELTKGKGKEKKRFLTTPANEYASKCITRVNEFHESYQSRVKLIVESSIGQEQLRGNIQGLKACCENETKATRLNLGTNNKLDWVVNLKKYRSIYCSLLNEAQDPNACIFINKVANK